VLIGQPEGLPNIISKSWYALVHKREVENRGCVPGVVALPDNNIVYTPSETWGAYRLYIDASQSNPIYGRINHVIPANITLRFYLRLA